MNLADLRRTIPELEGLDDDSAVDAIHQAYYPDLDRQKIADRLGVKARVVEEPVQPRGLLRGVADLGIEAVSGVARGVKFTADAFGADNAVSRGAGTVDEFAREYLSAQAKQDDRRVGEIMAAAEDQGVWEQVKAAAQAFAVKPVGMAVNALGTSVPTIGAALLPGVGQAGAGARLGMLAGMGAVQGAGTVKGSIYERVKAQYEQAGASPEDAAAAAQEAQEYGGENTGNIAAGAGLGAAASSTGAQPILARLLSRQAAAQGAERGVLGSAAMGVLKETPLEAAQGGQEQYAGNVALDNEGFEVSPWRGVAGNAALEGMAAAPMGAVTGAFDRRAADPDVALQRIASADNVGDMVTAAEDLAMAPLGPTQFDADGVALPADATPRQRNASAIAEIRQLDPEQQTEAMSLLGAASNMQAPGHVRRFAQNRLDELLLPVRQIPVGEVTEDEVIPAGESQELSMSEATGQILREPEPGQWLKPGERIPTGDATEMQPEAPAVERKARRIPTGEATELEVEQIQADDLLTADGMPYGTKSAASVRATREGGGDVVQVPGGFVVRKESESVDQRNLAGTAPVPDGAGAGRGADAGGSVGDVRPVPAAAGGTAAGSAAAPSGSGGAGSPVGAAGGSYAALSDDIPTLKKQWAEAVRANDNARAKRINDRIIEVKAAPNNPPPRVEPGTSGQEGGIADKPGSDQPEAAQNIDAAANQAATSPANDLPQPTEAQKKAGNYAKGHAAIGGLDLTIENPAGSTRSGTDRDGKAWTNTLQHHYGYIKGTVGNDKDHVDVFVKPGTPQDHAGTVFVVDQIHPDTGKFDEHKALIGFADEAEARAAYAANYAPGWKGLQSITALPFDGFKTWAMDGAKRKPAASLKDRVDAKRQQAEPAAPGLTALRDELRKVEDAILRAAPAKFGGGGGDIEAAMKRREVPAALKERRKSLRDQIRAASQDAAAPADQTAPAQAAVPEAAAPVPRETDEQRVERIRATPNAQRTDADLDWMRARSKAEQQAREDAERADREAKVEANRGKSIKQRAADATLDKQIRETSTGNVITRREWVANRLAEGAQLRVEQEDKIKPMSRMEFFRADNKQQREHEARVKAAGKKDVFYIGDYEVTKTEYDYAQERKAGSQPNETTETPSAQAASERPVVSQATNEAAPVAEPKPKRPPKSFRKKVKVQTQVFVEETAAFESREIDADTALKALDEDISEMDAFMKCLKA